MKESKRIYRLNKRRFITTIMYHFETVSKFCAVANISRPRFYKVMNLSFTSKNPPSVVRFINLINDKAGSEYDPEIFWSKIYE